jgi:release factor glutamine methyltransferase
MWRTTGKNLWSWRHEMRQQTEEKGIDPRELDWFLGWVSDLDSLTLKLGLLRQLPEVSLKLSLQDLAGLWQQRLHDRVPVQYLVGQTTWRNFTLKVSPSVLIPRPETELMIDRVAEAVAASPLRQDLERGTWADMGTGSGAIALGLAEVLPAAQVIAVDQNPDALATADQNVRANALENRITLRQGNWFGPLEDAQLLCGLVSNPPYIPTGDLHTLQPEVIRHEPSLALDGGKDGLNHLRTLAHKAPNYLISGGVWMVEVMAGQGEAVRALLMETQQYRDIKIYPDLAGLDRFVMAYRR